LFSLQKKISAEITAIYNAEIRNVTMTMSVRWIYQLILVLHARTCRFRQALSAERMHNVSMAFAETFRATLSIAEVYNSLAKKALSAVTACVFTRQSKNSIAADARHLKRIILAPKAYSVYLVHVLMSLQIPSFAVKKRLIADQSVFS
jgi:hypothetical protein